MHWSRLVTIHQLRVFCAVSRLLSYTRAAEELGCKQPTVSAMVAELERATQLTLLEQRGKHLTLTDEGRELYAHAQQVVAAADEAWQALAEQRGNVLVVSRPLRVAADTTVGTYVMPRLLGAFHRRNPNVALHLSVANRAAVRASLLAGEVDLVISGRPPEVDGLVAEPFLANPLVAIASPEHELVGQSQVSLPRLAEEVFLLREDGSGTRAALEEVFEIAGLPLKVGMVLGHVEAIKRAVAAKLGVSILSALAVQREVQYHTLAILDVEQFPIQRRWYIARLAERPLTASANVFIDFLHEYKQKSEQSRDVGQ
ncbi:MAG TPA: LysR substrate-binding domain-containing protein [Ktedonobacteraceae bacterium]|nr:LysR substrate-binding domain-containing protein [Ktedonobacteraceae bacterium]